MFSYQHVYHAGSLADIHKHAFLAVLVESLTQKDRPVSYLETHSGRGQYDISSPESLKTGEAKNGILRLVAEQGMSKDHPYWRAVGAHQEKFGRASYPGSPWIARSLLRDQDQLYLMECHPQEILHLKKNMNEPNVHVHERDGYEGVLALSPPEARRGLVFIDPTYEDKNEYARVVAFTKTLHDKWKEAVICVWYPLLRAGHQEKLTKALSQIDAEVNVWEISFPQNLVGYGLLGSGLYILNMPYGVKDALQKTDAHLTAWLKQTAVLAATEKKKNEDYFF